MKPYTGVLAFYAGLVWGEYQESVYDPFKPFRKDPLPDGAVIFINEMNVYTSAKQWCAADFTPILPEHVPKEYVLLEYLLR